MMTKAGNVGAVAPAVTSAQSRLGGPVPTRRPGGPVEAQSPTAAAFGPARHEVTVGHGDRGHGPGTGPVTNLTALPRLSVGVRGVHNGRPWSAGS